MVDKEKMYILKNCIVELKFEKNWNVCAVYDNREPKSILWIL